MVRPRIDMLSVFITPWTNPTRIQCAIIVAVRSQTASNRWGDYSSLSVDPVDQCSFWYTQEYYAVTGSFNWATRIGSFKFNSCKGRSQ